MFQKTKIKAKRVSVHHDEVQTLKDFFFLSLNTYNIYTEILKFIYLACDSDHVLELGDVQLVERFTDLCGKTLRDTLSVGLQILKEIFAPRPIRQIEPIGIGVLQSVTTLCACVCVSQGFRSNERWME